MITILQQLTIYEVLLLSLGINILLYLFSIGFYYFVDRIVRKESLQPQNQVLTRSDFLTSLWVLICNALIFVLGVLLWRHHFISVNENAGTLQIVAEVVILILAMDLLMYIFHRVAHIPLFYRIIHGRHHDHVSTNAISLFVMHPAEAIGFGLTFIFTLCWYPFSAIAIAIYVVINLLWGTIGHLNKEVLPARWSAFLNNLMLGTTLFHNRHHQHPNSNFGFYTSLWDKLFGTLDSKKQIEH